MPHLKRGNFPDDLIQFARLLPKEDRFYKHPTSSVRRLLTELADCWNAVMTMRAERKDAFITGRKHYPAAQRAATGAEAHDAEDGK